jgi:hypothetical protein
MITALIILGIFIGLGSWFSYMIDNVYGFYVAFVLVALGTAIHFSIKDFKETNHCLETVQPIVPRIVYLSDSSKKILKYTHEGEEHTIELDRKNNNFYIPESLLKIEPCNKRVIVKKD